MNPEITQAIQAALDAQFKAGAAIGKLEMLIAQAMPKPETTPETDQEP
jgi:hypothetical protein